MNECVCDCVYVCVCVCKTGMPEFRAVIAAAASAAWQTGSGAVQHGRRRLQQQAPLSLPSLECFMVRYTECTTRPPIIYVMMMVGLCQSR